MPQTTEKTEETEIKGELIVIEKLNLPEVFTEDGVSKLLKAIEKQVVSIVPDLKTDKGRKAIASLAYKISQCKKPLEDAGKLLVADQKKAIKTVDSSRIDLMTGLDEIRDKIRAPLTEWEEEDARLKAEATAKEVARMDYIERIIQGFIDYSADALQPDVDYQFIEDTFFELKGFEIGHSYEEFQPYAIATMGECLTKISDAMQRRKTWDEDQKRLAEQKKQQEAQEAELEKQREIMAKQQKKMDDQQAQIDRQEEERQAKIRDEDAAHQKKIDDELRVKKEAEETEKRKVHLAAVAKQAKEDGEREAREQLEREAQKKIDDEAQAAEETRLKAEQAPDKEKLLSVFNKLNQSDRLSLKSKKAQKVWVKFSNEFEILLQNFDENINSL